MNWLRHVKNLIEAQTREKRQREKGWGKWGGSCLIHTESKSAGTNPLESHRIKIRESCSVNTNSFVIYAIAHTRRDREIATGLHHHDEEERQTCLAIVELRGSKQCPSSLDLGPAPICSEDVLRGQERTAAEPRRPSQGEQGPPLGRSAHARFRPLRVSHGALRERERDARMGKKDGGGTLLFVLAADRDRTVPAPARLGG